MRILLIKTSSMGDVIHTLPALTDAGKAIPNIVFDWVVEESFAEIPHWHPLVDTVIPVALRRWRKNIFSEKTRKEWRQFKELLHAHDYDLILDAQGLSKSAFLSLFARGKCAGLDFSSAREALASFAYRYKYKVNFYQHAVSRMRQLFSQALGYELPKTIPDFNLNGGQFNKVEQEENYLVFLHGTTWASKQWPETYWVQLAELAKAAGYRVKMSGGNDEEVARAKRLAEQASNIDVMPRLSIGTMARLLANAKAAVAVDTGFGHLSAALEVPTVSIYGSTNPEYTGALGKASIHLSAKFSCAPCLNRTCQYKKPAVVVPACYATVPPALVWDTVVKMLEQARDSYITE